jgi:EAL domain-containing protein (putative c-di-GMP-specific phosphodiesterase class I)
MTAVAEGIEMIAQLERLRTLGCDIGQGYYFSRPVEPAALGFGLGA